MDDVLLGIVLRRLEHFPLAEPVTAQCAGGPVR